MTRTEKRRIGDIGEEVACRFLERKGFSIVERNYLKKWGEIDIVAKKKNTLHFVEVKTVSREIAADVPLKTNLYRPEDNIHPDKLKRMKRAIQTYVAERGIKIALPHEKTKKDMLRIQADVVTVLLDLVSQQARTKFIDNVILDFGDFWS